MEIPVDRQPPFPSKVVRPQLADGVELLVTAGSCPAGSSPILVRVRLLARIGRDHADGIQKPALAES